ncbi:hypothetical protein HGRIS_005936 [Hohenbuehelia grisea]|uniref:Pentatricopeptide repeat-containing protein n=1 Tax=Hohenbuehelia grisea TaxID=104357 RepID=A0ABR3JYT9_9AGAR
MSSCRRLLLQVHVSVRRFPFTQLSFPPDAISRARSFTCQQPTPHTLFRVLSTQNSDPRDDTAANTQPSEPSPVHNHDSIGPATTRVLQAAQKQGPVEGSRTRAVLADLPAYERVRVQDPAQVAAMPNSVWLALIDQAFAEDKVESLGHIIEDVLERPLYAQRTRAAAIIRLLERVESPTLTPEYFRRLVDYAAASPEMMHFIPQDLIESVVTWFSSKVEQTRTRSATALKTLCIHHINHMRGASGAALIQYQPPSFIIAVFSFIQRLVRQEANSLALDLFQALVAKRYIPPEGISDHSSQDFSSIILSALVRTSLHWGWRKFAVETLLNLFYLQKEHSDSQTDLAMDILFVLIDSPAPEDLKGFASTIFAMHRRAPDVEIAPTLIRKFYDRALELNMPHSAEKVYAFARSDVVRARHHYPPPQGLALVWLMRRLTVYRKNVHLARQLVAQVIEDNEPIMVQHRPTFVLLAAMNGLGYPARKLWVRYSVGVDKKAFLGHPALMIRMTSLFAHLTDVVREKLEAVDHSTDTEGEENPNSDRVANQEKWQMEAEDYATFTARIISEYVRVHRPLNTAHHHMLTSLARANFIAGRFADGFVALKYLLDRKEVPDLYDINVALSALAEHEPRVAARMIERMIEKGLQPDAVTFGTVIYHGLVHKEHEVVADMITRARALNGGKISVKAVAALIRACLTSDEDVRPETLMHAYNILLSLQKSSFSLSPSLGQPFVHAALRADDPRLAFKFWKILMLDKTQWDDPAQLSVRAMLASHIKKHIWQGPTEEAESASMLKQLQARRGWRA